MMSVLLSGADLIDLAVQTETRGERFYRQAAAATAKAEAKELFTYLGDQEVLHKRTFERLAGAIVATEIDTTTWDDALAYIEATVDSAFFGKDAPIQNIPAGTSVEEMLAQAIGFEQQTLLYFGSLRDLVQPANREVVDQIMVEERSHVRRLAAMLKEARAAG
jgi:rubrerythrin